MPKAYVGQVVLLASLPGWEGEWVPAIVEACCDMQIVGTAFINGSTTHIEGAKHIDDPWWKVGGREQLAIEEGVQAWKEASPPEAPIPRKSTTARKVLKPQAVAAG